MLVYFVVKCGCSQIVLIKTIYADFSTATSFRDNYIEGLVSFSNFTGKTFCAWDFAITSKSVASLHKKIIATDLKVFF